MTDQLQPLNTYFLSPNARPDNSSQVSQAGSTKNDEHVLDRRAQQHDLTRYTPSSRNRESAPASTYTIEGVHAVRISQSVATRISSSSQVFLVQPTSSGGSVYESFEPKAISEFKQILNNGQTRQTQYQQIDLYA